MNLFISLQGEILKIKRTAAVYLTIVAAFCVPAMVVFESAFDDEGEQTVRTDIWNWYLTQSITGLSFLILPMFIVLITALLGQIEYRNNTWKQVFAAPSPIGNLFLSKFLSLQLMIIVFLVAFNVLTLLGGVIVGYIKPWMHLFEYSIDWSNLLILNAKGYAAVLGLSAFQFWLGFRMRNFIAPIGIGFVLWISGALFLFEMKWNYSDWHPYTYAFMVPLAKYAPKLDFIFLMSSLYIVGFLALAFVDFRRRALK